MMTGILFVLLLASICVNGYLFRENTNLKKERDYYLEVDEENERLRKQVINKKST